jgi:hypothetical protein
VKKTSFSLLRRMSMPKFPAIELDGTVLFEGCDIPQDQLEAAIRKRQGA